MLSITEMRDGKSTGVAIQLRGSIHPVHNHSERPRELTDLKDTPETLAFCSVVPGKCPRVREGVDISFEISNPLTGLALVSGKTSRLHRYLDRWVSDGWSFMSTAKTALDNAQLAFSPQTKRKDPERKRARIWAS